MNFRMKELRIYDATGYLVLAFFKYAYKITINVFGSCWPSGTQEHRFEASIRIIWAH